MKSFLTAVLLVFLIFGVGSVLADVPQLVNYQGELLDSGGGPAADGDYLIKFIIYDAAAAGTELWNSGFQTVTVNGGVFSIELGASPQPALPSNLFEDTIRYLGITVGVDPEMAPRTRLITVPYAYQALSASTLGALAPGDVALVSHNHDGVYSAVAHDHAGIYAEVTHPHSTNDITSGVFDDVRLSSNIPRLDATNVFTSTNYFNSDLRIRDGFLHFYRDNSSRWKVQDAASGGLRFWQVYNDGGGLQNAVRMEITDDGDVGVGTTAPDARFHAHESGKTNSAKFTSSYANTTTRIVSAEYTGVAGNYNMYAFYGVAWPNDYYGYGAWFEGGYRGLYAQGFYSGMRAYGLRDGGTGAVYGIHANAYGTTTGNHYAVYGYAGGSGTLYAGYFSGNVTVTGTLSKGGGSFKIDHPLDPENKYLYHSFVESPDMMNVYNGNIELDGNGEAVVYLPGYFDALNRDFRYQLTAIGAPGPNLYIAQKISGNSFMIAGGEPFSEVSWQVTGIRKDNWANQNRIRVEVEKNANEKGKYIHPEAFGLEAEKSIDYENNNQKEYTNDVMDR